MSWKDGRPPYMSTQRFTRARHTARQDSLHGRSQLQDKRRQSRQRPESPHDPEKPNEGSGGQADTEENSACPEPGGLSWECGTSVKTVAPGSISKLSEKSGRCVLKMITQILGKLFFFME